jgi:hypothetical protein
VLEQARVLEQVREPVPEQERVLEQGPALEQARAPVLEQGPVRERVPEQARVLEQAPGLELEPERRRIAPKRGQARDAAFTPRRGI